MHFALWLCARGIVSADDALAAIRYCDRQTPRIAQLALREHALTVEKVLRVLKRQAVSAELFGEIAIDMGYLTPEGVARLLKLQRESVPSLIETLVELMNYDRAMLHSAHAEFLEYLNVGVALEAVR
ncbi:MAG: hypothetical protein DCC67_04605 [Planctomycetota bacterium]|nr:MAG: hypothetical protein DCC67_04605 [Planctomycetota bacterium]